MNKKKAKIKEIKKILKYPHQKKPVEHEDDGDTSRSWCTWNSPERLRNKAGEKVNRRKNCDNPDQNNLKIFLSIEKSPWDLRRLALTQTLE